MTKKSYMQPAWNVVVISRKINIVTTSYQTDGLGSELNFDQSGANPDQAW